MNSENQNDEQTRQQQQANVRLAWILGGVSAFVFFSMMYYLRAQ